MRKLHSVQHSWAKNKSFFKFPQVIRAVNWTLYTIIVKTNFIEKHANRSYQPKTKEWEVTINTNNLGHWGGGLSFWQLKCAFLIYWNAVQSLTRNASPHGEAKQLILCKDVSVLRKEWHIHKSNEIELCLTNRSTCGPFISKGIY